MASMSISLPARLIDRLGICPCDDWRSTRPLSVAGPMASSRPSKRCNSGVRLTLAENPADRSWRISGATRPESQSDRPDGWLDATSMSPTKEMRSRRTRLPLASSCVRPGRVATTLSTAQPRPAGRTSSLMSRIVVSLAISAGSFSVARPGTCGIGIEAAMRMKLLRRRCAEADGSRPVLAWTPLPLPSLSRLTSICWPSAVSRNSGFMPVSSVASPVTT